MQLLGFRAVRKNSLRGFAIIKLPNGLIIHDVVIGQGGRAGAAWANLPSKPMIDSAGTALRDDAGKIRYSVVNEWSSLDNRSEFSRRVVALVRAQYPDALDPEGVP